jgi:hypothetical protein
MEDHIIQKAEEGAITFTGIQNGAFLDWALERGVVGVRDRHINADSTLTQLLYDSTSMSRAATHRLLFSMAVTYHSPLQMLTT